MLDDAYEIEWVGEDDGWLNWMGDIEDFLEGDGELYARSEGVRVMDSERVVASLVWDPNGWIRHVYVRPEYARQGLMRRMLAEYDGPLPLDGDFGDEGLRARMQEIVAEIRG